MKKVILALTVALTIVACNPSKQQNEESKTTEQTVVETAAIPLEEVLSSADKFIDKEVTFKGYVTHTCKHSGRRCFMKGEKGNMSLRVEAKGEIGGFNRELVGNEIALTGILKERRLSTDEINEMEKAIETKSMKSDGSEESCDTERANIKEMRKWMKENNKDYFAIYYVDGIKYNEL